MPAMKPMEPHELARWTRFAAKGGIGKCTAVQDCMAEGKEDLMFLKVGTLARIQRNTANASMHVF